MAAQILQNVAMIRYQVSVLFVKRVPMVCTVWRGEVKADSRHVKVRRIRLKLTVTDCSEG